MQSRLLVLVLSGLLFGLITGFAQSQVPVEPPGEKKDVADPPLKQVQDELEKLRAEVERLKREAALANRGGNDSRLQFLKASAGASAQTNLRPDEAQRYAWTAEQARRPAISPDGRWGFVEISGKGGFRPALLDFEAKIERVFVRPAAPRTAQGFFSADSRRLGVCYSGGEVDIFNLYDGKQHSIKIKHSISGFATVDFTPDGKQLIVAAHDGIRFIDLEQGREVRRFFTGMDVVNATAVSSDMKLVAFAGGSYTNTLTAICDTIRVIDVANEKVLFRISPTFRATGKHCFFLPERDHLLALQSERLSIFSLADNKELIHFPVSGTITAIAPTADGLFAAVATVNRGLQIWDLKRGNQRYAFEDDASFGFGGVAVSKDGKRLLATMRNGSVRLLKAPELPSLDGPDLPPPATLLTPASGSSVAPPAAAMISPVSRSSFYMLPSGSAAKKLSEAAKVAVGQPNLHSLGWTAGGQIIASGVEGPRVYNLQALTSEPLLPAVTMQRLDVRAMAVTPDGKRCVFDYSVRPDSFPLSVWDLEQKKELCRIEGFDQAVVAVAISRDGKFVCGSSSNQSTIVWDVETHDVAKTVKTAEDVEKLALSNDGKHLLAVSAGRFNLWDVGMGTLRSMSFTRNRASNCVFSPDGTSYINAQVGADSIVLQQGIQSRMAIKRWAGRNTGAIALSPDGSLLAIGSIDGRGEQVVHLWSMNKSRFIGTYEAGKSGTLLLAFSADGKRLATGGTDENLYIWDLPAGADTPTLRD